MKSNKKLYCMFPAGLIPDKWHGSNCENDAVMGIKSFIHCKCQEHQKPETTDTSQNQLNERSIIQPLSGAPENLQHMSWVSLWQIKHCIFTNPIWQEYFLGDIEYFCQNTRHGSLIHGKVPSFARIPWKFSCTEESWTHIIMMDQLLHIRQYQFEIETGWAILSRCVRMWDTGSSIHGKCNGVIRQRARYVSRAG